MKITTKQFMIASVALIMMSGCTTVNPYTREDQTSKAAIGAGIGALAGAGIGLLTGDNAKERRNRALVGAGIGGLSGGGIGYYMDVQEAKLRQELEASGVSVTRNGNTITLNMDQTINFDTGRHELRSSAYSVLNGVSTVLAEYDQTTIDVMGHTDGDGAQDYNQELSERRAFSVASYLQARGVSPARLLAAGYGESRPPVATSSLKRRVRIASGMPRPESR
ncbi:MAG: OmpA family protein, partial [Pseudomonadota bacterium]